METNKKLMRIDTFMKEYKQHNWKDRDELSRMQPETFKDISNNIHFFIYIDINHNKEEFETPKFDSILDSPK